MAATLLLIVAAIASTARTASDLLARSNRPHTLPRQVIENWRSYATVGHREGPADARVTVVVFWDFECSTCASFSRRVAPLLERYPSDLALLYRPLPLEYHARGFTAAIAGECAARQGKYVEFHRLVLSLGDSLIDGPWSPLAQDAGVSDVAQFDHCVADPLTSTLLRPHSEAAATLGIRETPTMIVGGELYAGIPWDFEAILERHVRAAIASGPSE